MKTLSNTVKIARNEACADFHAVLRSEKGVSNEYSSPSSSSAFADNGFLQIEPGKAYSMGVYKLYKPEVFDFFSNGKIISVVFRDENRIIATVEKKK